MCAMTEKLRMRDWSMRYVNCTSPSLSPEETEARRGPGPVVVVRHAGLVEICHPTVAAAQAEREPARDVEVDAPEHVASHGRGGDVAARHDPRRDRRARHRPEHRTERRADERLDRRRRVI